jgi:hypothetical protein
MKGCGEQNATDSKMNDNIPVALAMWRSVGGLNRNLMSVLHVHVTVEKYTPLLTQCSGPQYVSLETIHA